MDKSILAQGIVILGGVLTLIFTIFEFKRKKTNKVIQIIGGSLTLIGSFMAYQENDKTTKVQLSLIEENKSLTVKNISLSNNNETLITKNIGLTSKIQDLVKINIDLTHIVTNNTNEINNQITGGNLKPKIRPSTFDRIHPDDIEFSVINNGKYPISNIGVEIIDLKFLSTFGSLNSEERLKAIEDNTTRISVGTLPKKSSIKLGRFKFSKEVKKVKFKVMVSWRNGHYQYYVDFERISPFNAFQTIKERIDGYQ